jgi:hypothetical protein
MAALPARSMRGQGPWLLAENGVPSRSGGCIFRTWTPACAGVTALLGAVLGLATEGDAELGDRVVAMCLDEREKPGFCSLDGCRLSCCKLAHVASC